MNNQQKQLTFNNYAPWLILALLCIALFMRLGALELNAEEPRRAVVAFEMLSSGEWIVPTAYGMPYYNKPPGYTWIMANFMRVFGTSEFVVRLTGILSLLGMAALIYFCSLKFWKKEQSFLAALIFLCSADLLFYASLFPAEIDLTFSFILFVEAIGIYLIGNSKQEYWTYIWTYFLLFVAIMIKGFLALHFHFFALITWTLYRGTFKDLFNYKHLRGIGLLLFSLFSYHLLYSLNGNLTNLLLNNFIESSSKITETSLGGILNQITECPLVLLKISLPWTLLLFLLLKKEWRQAVKRQPYLMFCILYILSNIWIYWFFVDVRDRYLYPFIPFLCILITGILYNKSLWPKYSKLIYGLMLTMAIGRLAYNEIIMPNMLNGQLSQNYIYRDLVDSILDKTEGQTFDLLTPKKDYELPFEYKGISHIERQPVVPYQIPYYAIQKTNHAPVVVDKIKKNKYYLAFKSQTSIIKSNKVLFEFTEKWYGEKMVLIKGN